MTLGPAVVEVWRAELDRARFESLITAAERERARRFRSDAARDRWIAGRGALRELLGRYLDRNPEEIVLATEPGGKPALAGSPSLQFNLSHSQGTAVFAFAHGNSVGVDVELIDRCVGDLLAVAARALGDAEAQRLGRLPEERRNREFLRSWVRHEAAVKCRGGGLGSAHDTAGLWVAEVVVGADAVAALAAEREPREVRVRVLE